MEVMFLEMECGYFSWCLFADCKASLSASAVSGALLSPEQGASNSLSVCFGLGSAAAAVAGGVSDVSWPSPGVARQRPIAELVEVVPWQSS